MLKLSVVDPAKEKKKSSGDPLILELSTFAVAVSSKVPGSPELSSYILRVTASEGDPVVYSFTRNPQSFAVLDG